MLITMMSMTRIPAPRGFALAILVSLTVHAALLAALRPWSAGEPSGAVPLRVGLLLQGDGEKAGGNEARPAGRAVMPAAMPARTTPPAAAVHPLKTPSSSTSTMASQTADRVLLVGKSVEAAATPAQKLTPSPTQSQTAPAEAGHASATGAAAKPVTAPRENGPTGGNDGGAVSGQGQGGGHAITPARYGPSYLDHPRPAYPARSRDLGEEGRVELKVWVGRDGIPIEVQIARSSNFPRLDRAAQQAVERWRFVPAHDGNTPIESWMTMAIPFSLTDN